MMNVSVDVTRSSSSAGSVDAVLSSSEKSGKNFSSGIASSPVELKVMVERISFTFSLNCELKLKLILFVVRGRKKINDKKVKSRSLVERSASLFQATLDLLISMHALICR